VKPDNRLRCLKLWWCVSRCYHPARLIHHQNTRLGWGCALAKQDTQQPRASDAYWSYALREDAKRQRLSIVYYRLLRESPQFVSKLLECYRQMAKAEDRVAIAEAFAKQHYVRTQDVLFSFELWEATGDTLLTAAPTPVAVSVPDTSVRFHATISVTGDVYYSGGRQRLLEDFEHHVNTLRQQLLQQIDSAEKRLHDAGFTLTIPRYEDEEDLIRKARALILRLHQRKSWEQVAIAMGLPNRTTAQTLVTEARRVLGI
jgi:hypothetical protein